MTDHCWYYQGPKGIPEGRPYIQADNKNYTVARLVYMWFHRRDEEYMDGLHVRHLCQNEECVRPDHLLEGTAKDNRRDHIAELHFEGEYFMGMQKISRERLEDVLAAEYT